MTKPGSLFIVGLGPGDRSAMTGQAIDALSHAGVVIGYSGYLAGIRDLIGGAEVMARPLGEEVERALLAVRLAREGKIVCVVSSGDAGIYGMASVVLEALDGLDESVRPSVEVIPGVSAVNAAAALLGAPLGHDFAVISLSDLLTPWEVIERRLGAAAAADFVLALLNPCSPRRSWQLSSAREILLRHRSPETPVGIVRNAYRPEQAVDVVTLGRMLEVRVDMFTTVIVGNAATRHCHNQMVTPRGYAVRGDR